MTANRRHRSRKDATIASTLAIAVSLVAGGVIANAQSFQTSGYSVPAGSATSYAGTDGSGHPATYIQVTSNNAVIDWSPSDTAIGGGSINFQPANTSAIFQGNLGFTVLNRIVPVDPTRAIQLNGAVLSQQYLPLGGTATGGTVFFYSPGGIIVGSTATFDVGNLGLTTSDLNYDPTTADFGGANGLVTFQQATQSTSGISIASGATINALNAGSYVAMFAPSVNNAGTVNVNGAAALVAAEGGTIRFSPDGLFDIQATVGSDAGANALVNTGTITGTAGTAGSEYHRIYMVAVPKNTAIGMVIGGGSSLGFDVASAADTDGNAVILSAGNDILGGVIGSGSAAGSSAPAAISIADAGGAIEFTSAVQARANAFDLTSTGAITFDAFLDATGTSTASIFANGGAVAVNGDLRVQTDSYATDPALPTDGGAIAISAANAGSLDVTGSTTLVASALSDRNGDGILAGGSIFVGTMTADASMTFGGNLSLDVTANDGEPVYKPAVGGTAQLSASYGSISVAGATQLDASAFSTSSSTATGGTVIVSADSGGSLTLGELTGLANAAANVITVPGAAGADATGGQIYLGAHGAGSMLRVNGGATLSANGQAGNGNCSACAVDGGAGQGGIINIDADLATTGLTINGASLAANGYGGNGTGGNGGAAFGGSATITGAGITIFGDANLSAGAIGGAQLSGLDGGDATGGTAGLQSAAGAPIRIVGGLTAVSSAFGGTSYAPGGTGGKGAGGTSSIYVPEGTVRFSPDASGYAAYVLDSSGAGGNGTNGGDGVGGFSTISVGATSNGPGQFLVNSDSPGSSLSVVLSSLGYAGAPSFTGGISGTATGGDAHIDATLGGTVDIAAAVNLFGSGIAVTGIADGNDGGDGSGGTAYISQDSGGSIAIDGDVSLEANGNGTENTGGGDRIAGNGMGGTVRIAVNDPGGISITGNTLSLSATGTGGNGTSDALAASGGAGLGGHVDIGALNGSASIFAAVTMDVTGTGGTAYFSGNGGDGTGGEALIGTGTGTSAASIEVGDGNAPISMYAGGIGGAGADTGNGGTGTGGLAQVFAIGGDVTLNGSLFAAADGSGGASGLNGGSAGVGLGGRSELNGSNGYVLTINGDTQIEATGTGGENFNGGVGGAGTGGNANIFGNTGGSLVFNGGVQALATAGGGRSLNTGGIGGAAHGGSAHFRVEAGSATVTGDLRIAASAIGGDGDEGTGAGGGGAGTGGNAFLEVDGDGGTNAGPGSLGVGGSIMVDASALGGSGGTGGAGAGGNAEVYARNGTITGGSASLVANGTGGNGLGGGAGGAATGGQAYLQAFNSTNGASLIALNSLDAGASATGGAGGDGISDGQAGGTGGAATGGSVLVLGSAGNGTVNIATVAAGATGYGGSGGNGYGYGNPDAFIDGDGGAGGMATGGHIQIGIQSDIATATNAGLATFGTISAIADAIGGNGGAGGTASTLGNGGAGGAAFATSGGAVILVRGSLVTISGDTSLSGNATGGDGGAGTTTGAGGNASIGGGGGVGVIVSNRYLQPALPGTLIAGDIYGSAVATGGSGSVAGQSIDLGSAINIQVVNSSATATSIGFNSGALQPGANAPASTVQVINGSLSLTNSLSFVSSGPVTLDLDTGDITVAGMFSMQGSDWLRPSAAPALAGTVHAGAVQFATLGDIASYANLDIGSDTALTAPGSIRFGNVTGGNALFAQAYGGDVALGNLVLSNLDVVAPGFVQLGTITNSGYADLTAGMGVSTGAASTGRYFDASSGGGITVTGDIQAGADVTFTAAGNIAVNGVSAGIVNPSSVTGDTHSIGLYAQGSVTAGDLAALEDVGVAGAQSISVGAVSGQDMQFLGGTSATIGSINAGGRVLLADYSMLGLGLNAGGYDKEPAFAVLPVAMSGPITINGATIAGDFFHAATQQSFTSGDITAPGGVAIAAGTGIGAGAIDSGTQATSLTASGGDVLAGDVTAGNLATTAFGALTLGNVQVAGNVALQSTAGSILTGAIQSTAGTISLSAAQAIGTGNLGATGAVTASAGQGLTTGNITSGGALTLIAGTTIAIGNAVAASGFVASAGQSLTSGSITTGSDLAISAGGNAVTGDIAAGGAIGISAGGRIGAGLVNAGGDVTLGAGTTLAASGIQAVSGQVTLTSGGATTLSGPVRTLNFTAQSGGAFSAMRIDATNAISVTATGLATVGARWAAPQITVRSGDIDIRPANAATGAPGGLYAGLMGTIRLISTSAAGMFIGDGLAAGSGYALSNAEWALINSGSLYLLAPDLATLGTDMTIGNLSITGPLAGSTIDDPNGVVQFATGNAATGGAGGTIRIVGNLAATGFMPTNRLVFDAGAFELDASTGSVKIQDGAGGLGGLIEVTADYIHIADGIVLDKLRSNPFYTGRFVDLNGPAAAQRPDGVFNALGFDLYPGQTLYIQNTGTSALPAGFLTMFDGIDVTVPAVLPAGGISVIINGAFQTANGLSTGADAYNLLINRPGIDFTGIGTDSTFNGCLLAAGTCGSDPAVSISDEFGQLSTDKLSDEPFGQQEGESQEEQRDDADASAATSKGPIAPPAPLIDSRPLRPPVLITEPQTGSGNPSLQGTGDVPATGGAQ